MFGRPLNRRHSLPRVSLSPSSSVAERVRVDPAQRSSARVYHSLRARYDLEEGSVFEPVAPGLARLRIVSSMCTRSESRANPSAYRGETA